VFLFVWNLTLDLSGLGDPALFAWNLTLDLSGLGDPASS
jgi:hypothetical protein